VSYRPTPLKFSYEEHYLKSVFDLICL
jgi:hypothetical protein